MESSAGQVAHSPLRDGEDTIRVCELFDAVAFGCYLDLPGFRDVANGDLILQTAKLRDLGKANLLVLWQLVLEGASQVDL